MWIYINSIGQVSLKNMCIHKFKNLKSPIVLCNTQSITIFYNHNLSLHKLIMMIKVYSKTNCQTMIMAIECDEWICKSINV